MNKKPILREEKVSDYQDISDIHIINFKHDLEAKLIEGLRQVEGYQTYFSQVVELDGKVVGHLMATPVKITNCSKEYDALIIGPVGINKEYHGQGLGTFLVSESLKVFKAHGWKIALVYGGDYYHRFGFKKAKTVFRPNPVFGHGILMKKMGLCPFKKIIGVIHYPSPFNPLINEWTR